MPLMHSGDPAAVKSNIHEMVRSGYPVKRAVAAALRTADQYGKRRAAGGSSGANAGAPGTAYAPTGASNGNASAAPEVSVGYGGDYYTPPPTGSSSTIVPNAPQRASAPTVPTYGTSTFMATPSATPNSPSGLGQPATYSRGILPSGLMNVPQVGNYTLDPNTGALSAKTLAALSSYAMRGLPPSSTAPGYNSTGTGPAPVAATAPDPAQAMLFGIPETDFGTNGNRGGRMPRRASGGGAPIASMASSMAQSGFRSIDHPAGLVHGIGAGRTDTVPMNVAAGSHVIPSDVIAGIGQDNTLSGAHAMGMAMKTGPGGITLPSGPHRAMGMPKMPSYSAMQGLSSPHLARGGDPQFEGNAIKIARGGAANGVKCIVANGEWIMKPDEVERTSYKGKSGHEAIDAWIMDRRREHTKKLRELRPPVGMKR